MQTPTTRQEWEKVAQDYQLHWQFPNCLGSLDGKHIQIKQPPGTGSFFYNYKGTFSIILLALVDARYRFLFADVGTNGRISDGGVWSKCALRHQIESGQIELPPPAKLPNSEKVLPHVILGDNAFPLTENLMKPFPHRQQTHSQRVFSYRLSLARRTVENAFGILANRFRVFNLQ